MKNSINSVLLRIEKRNLIFVFCVGIISFLFLLLCSPYTSILNSYYGYDSAVFMVVGKGMSKGFVPYRDLFDHKGPLLYLLNAVGFWMFDGKLGVLLIQTIFMMTVLVTIYKTARLYVTPTLSVTVVAIFMFLYCAMISEGNMTEEWSLIFNVFPIYLILSYYRKGNVTLNHPFLYSFIYGLCLGAHTMIRINNAAVLCGMFLCFAIMLIREKAIGKLIAHMLVVLLGAFVVVVPFAVYFAANHAFSDFIYANFIYNFLYASDGSSSKSLVDWLFVCVRISSLAILIWSAFACRKAKLIDDNSCFITISMGAVSALTMFLGYGWLHYYLVYVPIMLVGVAFAFLYFSSFPLKVKIAKLSHFTSSFTLVTIVILMPFLWSGIRHIGKNVLFDFAGYFDENVRSVTELVSSIPKNERDSVWSYDVQPQFYLYADIIPCYKYFTLQSFQSQSNEFIMPGIKEMLSNTPPNWIVISGTSQLKNDDLVEKLTEDYRLVSEVNYGLNLRLYRLMEGD